MATCGRNGAGRYTGAVVFPVDVMFKGEVIYFARALPMQLRRGRIPARKGLERGEVPLGARPETEAAQECALLALVRLHAAHDIVEDADRFEDVRALVEHNAFGALAHGRVGD